MTYTIKPLVFLDGHADGLRVSYAVVARLGGGFSAMSFPSDDHGGLWQVHARQDQAIAACQAHHDASIREWVEEKQCNT